MKKLFFLFYLLQTNINIQRDANNCETKGRLPKNMPSSKRSSHGTPFGRLQSTLMHNVAFIVLGLLICLIHLINGQQSNSPQTCPTAVEINPCVCQVKKNGLDILCEATDVIHINKAMTALKPKSPIIFYLKLRHNNLPKLQGFIFLALDIRHLTIHNSSLAVIEETSLSSLGESHRN